MFLPDGRHFLYMTPNFAGQTGVDAIFVGSLDSNEKHLVNEANANAVYASPGYLLFYRDKTLFAQHFDLKRFVVTGEPTTLLTDILYEPQIKRAVFDASERVLVAQSGSGVALSHLVWFDRKGGQSGAVGKPDVFGNIFIAPNGRAVAVDKTDMETLNNDVWTYELAGDSAKKLTFGRGISAAPVWSPDAIRLVFASNRQSNDDGNRPRRRITVDLYVKNSDGSQEEKSLVHNDTDKYPSDWSRDGKYIMFTQDKDLWQVSTGPELKSSLFLKAPSVLRNGQFSPDGKWVAYASNETGKWEIYVTSFPESHGKWQVSTGGGEQPRWRGDGKELFYLSSDEKMISVPVTTGARFDAGTPVVLFQATPRQPVPSYDLFVYDVSRDGQRFLINTQLKQPETQPVSVILNWPAKQSK